MVAAPFLLSASGWASAQVTASAPSLRETVVSVTRSEQPLSDVVADVSIIDRITIERSGAGGLADVLARIPGVEFVRNGGPGNATSVYVRGAENRFTALYLDGVRIDSQSTGGVSWENIPLALIDRIEVLRGPAAAVYGSDALAGVVQIFTRKGEGGFSPSVGLGVGDRGTRKLDAAISGGAGMWDYAIGLASERSNGFNSRPVAGQNPDTDGYRSQAAHANLGLQINAAHRLDATALASQMNSQYDSSTVFADERNHHKLQTLGLVWRAKWSEIYNTRLTLSDSVSRYETTPSPYLTQTHLRGLLFQNEVRLGAHQWSAVLEHKGDALDNAATSFSPGISKGRYQNGLGLGWGLGSGPHTVQVNVRRDRDSEFGDKSTGSAAYAYALNHQWRVTASAGTGFRAPTLYQRFSEYGVASLKPESSRNIEAGLRYAAGSSQFGIVAYKSRVTNLISFSSPGTCLSTLGCYANTARAQYEGVTVSGKHRLGRVDLRASVDLQSPRDLDTGKLLARRARQHAVIGADTRAGDWLVGAELQATGRRFSGTGETLSLPGYNLINLTASTRVANEWTLLARIDNLSNRYYQSISGYATPGRMLYVGLKWSQQ